MFNIFRRKQREELQAEEATQATGGGAAPAPPPPSQAAPSSAEALRNSFRRNSSHKIQAAQAKEKLSTLGGSKDVTPDDAKVIEAMRTGEYSLAELIAMRANLKASKSSG
jgi:hypothetical protein